MAICQTRKHSSTNYLLILQFAVFLMLVTNFATKLEELLARKKMKPVELARAAGLAPSTVSRWLNLERASVSEKDLTSAALALSSDHRDHAELLRARMLDLCRGPGSNLIEISIDGRRIAAIRETAPEYARLPKELEDCLRVLREHIQKDSILRGLLMSIARAKTKGTLGD